MNDNHRKVAVLAVAALMLAIPFAVCVDDEVEEDEAFGFDIFDIGGHIQKMRLLIGGFYATVGGMIEDYGLNLMKSALSNEPVITPAGDSEEVKAGLAKLEASNTVYTLDLLALMASSLIDNDAQTWALTQSYLDRTAEISAGSLWSQDAIFDADTILTFGDVYTIIAMADGNTQNALDNSFDRGGNRFDTWNADENLGEIKGQFAWNGARTEYVGSNLAIDFSVIVKADAFNNLVYLNAWDSASSIIAMQPSTITSVGEERSYALSKGYNSLNGLGITSGWYKLSNGTFAGQFYPSTNLDKTAHCSGGMVFLAGDNTGYMTVGTDGLEITYNDNKYVSRSFVYNYAAGGDVKSTSDYQEDGADDPIYKLVKSYSEYYKGLTARLTTSAQAALVMWNISSVARESNILLSPSSVIPQLQNMDVDANQAYALYVAALDQIAAYNATHGRILADQSMFISEQSMKLYCEGTIYDSSGNIVAQNAIFTPYVYTKDFTVTKGNNSFGQQTGIIMVWANGALDAWDGKSESQQLIMMSDTSYFNVLKMTYDSREVDSMELLVKDIQKIGIDPMKQKEPVDPIKTLDADLMTRIIVIELGLIVALLGVVFRSKWLIISGGVLGAFGLFFGDLVARLFLEVFG